MNPLTPKPQPISVRVSCGDVHGGLVPLVGDEIKAACNIHASALAGLIMPLVGHVVAPWLVRRSTAATSPAVHQHYLTALAFHLWWGLVLAAGYTALWLFGWVLLPLVVLIALIWGIQTVLVLASVETGRQARYYWFIDLIS